MKESLINTPIEIFRVFSKYDSNQVVGTHNSNEWRVSDLKALVKECDLKPFDFPLQLVDLHTHKFQCDDLYEFMQHFRMVESANEEEPIIISHRGQILDGRHRICKAILAGKTHVKAVKFESDVTPTRRQ